MPPKKAASRGAGKKKAATKSPKRAKAGSRSRKPAAKPKAKAKAKKTKSPAKKTKRATTKSKSPARARAVAAAPAGIMNLFRAPAARAAAAVGATPAASEKRRKQMQLINAFRAHVQAQNPGLKGVALAALVSELTRNGKKAEWLKQQEGVAPGAGPVQAAADAVIAQAVRTSPVVPTVTAADVSDAVRRSPTVQAAVAQAVENAIEANPGLTKAEAQQAVVRSPEVVQAVQRVIRNSPVVQAMIADDIDNGAYVAPGLLFSPTEEARDKERALRTQKFAKANEAIAILRRKIAEAEAARKSVVEVNALKKQLAEATKAHGKLKDQSSRLKQATPTSSMSAERIEAAIRDVSAKMAAASPGSAKADLQRELNELTRQLSAKQAKDKYHMLALKWGTAAPNDVALERERAKIDKQRKVLGGLFESGAPVTPSGLRSKEKASTEMPEWKKKLIARRTATPEAERKELKPKCDKGRECLFFLLRTLTIQAMKDQQTAIHALEALNQKITKQMLAARPGTAEQGKLAEQKRENEKKIMKCQTILGTRSSTGTRTRGLNETSLMGYLNQLDVLQADNRKITPEEMRDLKGKFPDNREVEAIISTLAATETEREQRLGRVASANPPKKSRFEGLVQGITNTLPKASTVLKSALVLVGVVGVAGALAAGYYYSPEIVTAAKTAIDAGHAAGSKAIEAMTGVYNAMPSVSQFMSSAAGSAYNAGANAVSAIRNATSAVGTTGVAAATTAMNLARKGLQAVNRTTPTSMLTQMPTPTPTPTPTADSIWEQWANWGK